MAKRRYATRMTLTFAAILSSTGLLAGLAAADTVPSITTVAGNGVKGSTGDGGPAVNAELNNPTGIAEDLAGSLFFADTGNNKVRKIVTPTAIHVDTVTTIAGTGSPSFGGDENQATSAQLHGPTGVAVDSHGDVFIADSGNNRVREINTSGIISTVAGTGSCGKKKDLGNGGPATQASLCNPTGIVVDHTGDLFISDTGHDMVREVPHGGPIVAFAGIGKPGYKGDGGLAVDARLKTPTGLAIDAVGDVYIADTDNNTVRVVKNGIISTLARGDQHGRGRDPKGSGASGLKRPTGLGVDPSGDMFIADTGNNRIEEVTASDGMTTIAGTGRAGFSGDGGPATAAELNGPLGVVADGSAVYFVDSRNQRLRGIFNGPPPVLPQTALTVLLPVSAAVLIGSAAFLVGWRRRRTRLATALADPQRSQPGGRPCRSSLVRALFTTGSWPAICFQFITRRCWITSNERGMAPCLSSLSG
jgi:hypothetical protein